MGIINEVFQKNQAKPKNEEDIGDVFREERQTEENARENQVTVCMSFTKYKVGEEGERSEDPEQRVGIDNFTHPDEERGRRKESVPKEGRAVSE